MAAATTATPIPPPFFSPYLDDQSGKIQAKGVPWEASYHLRPRTTS
jgi:V-type H+-transporting ATPase subunit H